MKWIRHMHTTLQFFNHSKSTITLNHVLRWISFKRLQISFTVCSSQSSMYLITCVTRSELHVATRTPFCLVLAIDTLGMLKVNQIWTPGVIFWNFSSHGRELRILTTLMWFVTIYDSCRHADDHDVWLSGVKIPHHLRKQCPCFHWCKLSFMYIKMRLQ